MCKQVSLPAKEKGRVLSRVLSESLIGLLSTWPKIPFASSVHLSSLAQSRLRCPRFSTQPPARPPCVLDSGSKLEREKMAMLVKEEVPGFATELGGGTVSASRLGEVVLLDLLLRVGGGGFSLGMNGCNLSGKDRNGVNVENTQIAVPRSYPCGDSERF